MRRVLAGIVVCVAALAMPAGADPGTTTPAAPTADPLGVYFRDDAVGAAQRALVVSACGTERWTVKTGTDDDRHDVTAGALDATIRALRHKQTPATHPATSRVAPVETTKFRVHARLREYVREDDGDYHLVLADRHGRTIVAEVPDPGCVGHISPFRRQIRRARDRMDTHYSVTSSFKTTNRRVVVRGIGFFDYLHGQPGMAPNGLELHPILRIAFR